MLFIFGALFIVGIALVLAAVLDESKSHRPAVFGDVGRAWPPPGSDSG